MGRRLVPWPDAVSAWGDSTLATSSNVAATHVCRVSRRGIRSHDNGHCGRERRASRRHSRARRTTHAANRDHGTTHAANRDRDHHDHHARATNDPTDRDTRHAAGGSRTNTVPAARGGGTGHGTSAPPTRCVRALRSTSVTPRLSGEPTQGDHPCFGNR